MNIKGIKITAIDCTNYLKEQFENNENIEFNTFPNLDFVISLEEADLDFEISGYWQEIREDEFVACWSADNFCHNFEPEIKINYDSDPLMEIVQNKFSPHG